MLDGEKEPGNDDKLDDRGSATTPSLGDEHQHPSDESGGRDGDRIGDIEDGDIEDGDSSDNCCDDDDDGCGSYVAVYGSDDEYDDCGYDMLPAFQEEETR